MTCCRSHTSWRLLSTERPSRLFVRGLVAGYGGKAVLEGVSLLVEPGQVMAVLGHNGAGKSTLLRVVAGLLPAWSGEILFDGQHIEHVDVKQVRRMGIAFVPQGNRV